MSELSDTELQSVRPASKLVPLLLAVNAIATVIVLVVLLTRPSNGGMAKSEAPEHSNSAELDKPGPTLHLADFTARLHGSEADRYARLSIEIEVPTEKDKEELSQHVPQIRDSFISFLSDSSLEDLSGSDGLSKTKDKLSQRLHQLVPTLHVRGLYITDLVVQ